MKKILIIEDDPDVRDNIETLLNEFNYEVIQTQNGFEGIKKAQIENPDLIISDILMPDIDGYEVLEVLSKNEATSAIPFIFLTAKADFMDMRKGMDLGADDYLMKPFKAVQLINAIELRLAKVERLKAENIKKEAAELQPNKSNSISLVLGTTPVVIKMEEIVCIIADDVYSNVSLSNGKKILVRKLLKKWEEELNDRDFLRIHRSTIINTAFIDSVEKWFNGTYKMHMKYVEEAFIISRGYSKKLKKAFHI
jgi:Response regulator of the LytR/AlgR family